MKKIIGLAILATLGIATAPFASVNEVKAQAPAAAQGACTDDSKAAWYADFTKNRNVDNVKAYDAAKKYLTACPTEEGPIPTYLKKWVAAYEMEARHLKLNEYLVQKKYAETLTLAKEILTTEPEYLPATIYLGYGGYLLAVTTKNDSGSAEAVSYAKKAIAAIESGKTLENWAPFKSKDDALGYLYYAVGFLQRTSNPTDGLAAFIKAAQFESDIKKNANTYALIAGAYEADYARQSTDYEAKYKGKDETPESKLAVANINQVVDRIIDALARAVSVAGTDAAAQASKTAWLGRLTELYKFRKGSDAGLTDMIASVMSKPLPPVPTPLTTLPDTPAATTTPSATGSMNGGSSATTPSNTAATGNGAASTTTVGPTANSTKSAAKPKTRNNHRRP